MITKAAAKMAIANKNSLDFHHYRLHYIGMKNKLPTLKDRCVISPLSSNTLLNSYLPASAPASESPVTLTLLPTPALALSNVATAPLLTSCTSSPILTPSNSAMLQSTPATLLPSYARPFTSSPEMVSRV